MKDFDSTIYRDPADRAVVDKLRRYAEERGGSVFEFEWGHAGIPVCSFAFGWDREYITLFVCLGKQLDISLVEVRNSAKLT